jgi:MFS family permease
VISPRRRSTGHSDRRRGSLAPPGPPRPGEVGIAAVDTTETQSPIGVVKTLRATPRPVRYLLAGVVVNQLGAFLQTFVVLYLTAAHGYPVDRAGVVLTGYSAGAVFGTLLGGELTQRIGPRNTITGGMTVAALALAAVPLLAGPGRFGLLLVAVVLAGLATQSYRPAAAVLLAELMPAGARVMAFSMMRIGLNIGAALAPLIAAGLILLDWDLLFWLDAATALAYAVVARTLLPRTPAVRADDDEPAPAPAVYRVLLRDVRFLLFLLSTLLAALIYVQYTVALPLKIVAAGQPTALYSVVLTISSAVLVLCELKVTAYVGTWRPYLAGALGTLVMGLGVAGYGLGGNAVVIVLGTVVFVLGVMISGPMTFAHPATYPAAVRARYLGVHQAVFGLGLALGPVLGVLAWQTWGNAMWPACGVLGLLAAGCAAVGMRTAAARH